MIRSRAFRFIELKKFSMSTSSIDSLCLDSHIPCIASIVVSHPASRSAHNCKHPAAFLMTSFTTFITTLPAIRRRTSPDFDWSQSWVFVKVNYPASQKRLEWSFTVGCVKSFFKKFFFQKTVISYASWIFLDTSRTFCSLHLMFGHSSLIFVVFWCSCDPVVL